MQHEKLSKQFIIIVIPISAQNLLTVVPLGIFIAFILELPVLWVYVLLNIDEIIKLPAVYKYYKKYNWIKKIIKGWRVMDNIARRDAGLPYISDERVFEEQKRARRLTKALNTVDRSDFEKISEIVKELLGKSEGAFINPPF